MNIEYLQNKTTKNWLKTISLASLLLIGISCSQEDTIQDETTTLSAKSNNSVELSISNINASTQQSANPVSNAYDSSPTSRWSGNGRSVTFDIDLGSTNAVDYLMISYFKGNERNAYFDYYYSTNGTSWSGGKSKTSSGNTTSLELFDLDNSSGARYIRLVCKGTSSSSWNSILDVQVWGTPGDGGTSGGSISAYSRIQAESFNDDQGVQLSNGGAAIGYIGTGDWVKYENVNFDSGAKSVKARVSKGNSGTGKIDFRKGSSTGTILGSMSFGNTGGWTSFNELTADISNSSGTHDLYLVFTGNLDVDWFEFSKDVTDDPGTGNGDLDPNKSPAQNFDLSQWKLTPSSGNDYSVSQLNNNLVISNQFYTDPSDGGMVFKNYPKGAGTTTNSDYSRVELREMLDTNAPTKGLNKNNWVFSSSSSTNEAKSGGVGGKLTATLKVDRVTKTSSGTQQGRIVIGQIHASDNEPCRLYYKKMDGDTKGAIYFLHEDSNGNETAINMIGNYAKTGADTAGDYTGASQPSDGIPLGEVFSYKIEVIGTMLYVDIYRDGAADVSEEYNMSGSGYANDWMYFKAGLYSQNKSVSSSTDYEQVTFYALSNTHD